MNFNPTRINPELQRILRSSLSFKRMLFTSAITLVIVGIMAFVSWNDAQNHAPSIYELKEEAKRLGRYDLFDRLESLRNDYSYSVYSDEYIALKKHFPELKALEAEVKQERFGKNFIFPLSVVGFIVLFIAAPIATAFSFIQEKMRDTYIFQQMTLLSPAKLTAGKFLGWLALPYLVIAIVLPFWLFAAYCAALGIDAVVANLAFAFVCGFCCQAIGLFISAAISSSTEKTLRGGIFVMGFAGIVGALIGGWSLVFFQDYARNNLLLYFFDYHFAFFFGLLCILAFVGVWAFIGAVQKVRAGLLMSVSPAFVWLFIVLSELLLIGFFWGNRDWDGLSSYNHVHPLTGLITFMAINWLLVTGFSVSCALNRDSLREWLSVSDDAFHLLQRREIKNNFITLALALGLSQAGLFALWFSSRNTIIGTSHITDQLLPIAIAFGLTLIGTAAFIQFCAFYKFRLRAWAGVAFIVMFFIAAAIIGSVIKIEESPFMQVNPLVFAATLADNDPQMKPNVEEYEIERIQLNQKGGGHEYNMDYVVYGVKRITETSRSYYKSSVIVPIGLLTQFALAFVCCGLAFIKWRKTRKEILPVPQ